MFPQLRQDPVVDRWVLIAPERAARPRQLEDLSHLTHLSTCPFCEGHESETPQELFALRPGGTPADGPGWRVRVVPNRFPAVQRDVLPVDRPTRTLSAEPGWGIHEVVIETPRHETSLAALTAEEIGDVFGVFRDRLRQLRADSHLQYVQVFKNHGAAAGASVEHAHSQLLGTRWVPAAVLTELDAAESSHAARRGGCVFCDLIQAELAAGERVVFAGEHVVALAAWAGRFPFETWVLPRRHAAHYDRLSDAELTDVAAVMKTVLRRLAAVANGAAYNLILHTTPLLMGELSYYHWHWEVLPRLTGIAGYELATGCYLNPLPPEDAARQLRQEG